MLIDNDAYVYVNRIYSFNLMKIVGIISALLLNPILLI